MPGTKTWDAVDSGPEDSCEWVDALFESLVCGSSRHCLKFADRAVPKSSVTSAETSKYTKQDQSCVTHRLGRETGMRMQHASVLEDDSIDDVAEALVFGNERRRLKFTPAIPCAEDNSCEDSPDQESEIRQRHRTRKVRFNRRVRTRFFAVLS